MLQVISPTFHSISKFNNNSLLISCAEMGIFQNLIYLGQLGHSVTNNFSIRILVTYNIKSLNWIRIFCNTVHIRILDLHRPQFGSVSRCGPGKKLSGSKKIVIQSKLGYQFDKINLKCKLLNFLLLRIWPFLGALSANFYLLDLDPLGLP